MRAFLAVEVPETIRACYGEALKEFRRRMGGLRWVEPERLHLTLHFFEDIDDESAKALAEPVRAVTSLWKPFRVSLGRAGAFGSSRRPSVLWFDLKEGRPAMIKLQDRIEKVLREHGFPSDGRTWTPHITVARAKGRRGGGRPPALEEWIDAACASDLSGLWFEVDHLTLFRSDLGPEGPNYTPLWQAPLGANDS